MQTFTLPIKLDIYAGGKKIRKEILINSREQNFSFEVGAKPDLIDFDVDKILVGETNDNKTAENYYFQYKNAPSYANRIEALQFIMQSKANSGQMVLLEGLKDKSADLRALSIAGINLEDAQIKTAALPILLQIAKTDKNTEARSAAIVKLAETGDQTYKALVLESLKDRSYKVIAAGVDGLAKLAPQETMPAIAGLDEDTRAHIAPSIATLYINDPKDDYQAFYDNIMLTGDRDKVFGVVGQYFQYLRANTNPAVTEQGITNIGIAIERLKLQPYLNKQLAGAYTATAQGKAKQADAASGEAKAKLNKQAELFKKGAADLGKE